MSVLLKLVLVAGLAAAFGATVHFWRVQLEASRRDDMRALAGRRGWALTISGERLGRAGTLRLVPRGGLPWLAQARPARAAGGLITEYEAEEPRWPEGTLVLVAAPLPTGAETGSLPYQIALRDLLGADLSRQALSLRAVSSAEGVTALTDGNPALRADLGDLGSMLRAWGALGGGSRGRPVLILSPEGLRLRLRVAIRRPEQMERFLDLALELSRVIGP